VKLGAAVGDDFALVAIRSGTSGGTFGPWSGTIAAADPVGAGIGAGSFGRAFAGTASLVVSWGGPAMDGGPALGRSMSTGGPGGIRSALAVGGKPCGGGGGPAFVPLG